MKEFSLESVNISLEEDRVLYIKFNDKAKVDIVEAEKIMSTSYGMVGKEPFRLIVDARDVVSSVDYKARKFMSEHEVNKYNLAQAIVVNNMPVKLLANFYLNFHKHSHPIRVFNDMDVAKEWVMSKS